MEHTDDNFIASAHFNIGVSYMLDGDVQAEIDNYTKSIDRADDSSHQLASALVNRGVAYARTNQTQEAIEDLSKVIELFEYDDQVALALLSRSNVYFETKQSELGYSDLNRLITDPKCPIELKETAYLNRGHYKKLDSKLASSLKDYNNVVNSENHRNAASAPVSYTHLTLPTKA